MKIREERERQFTLTLSQVLIDVERCEMRECMCSGRTIGVPKENCVCRPYVFICFACQLCLGSIKSRVGDDGVPAILQYRPSDLYLADKKETMAIFQKDAHTHLHTCK